MNPALIRALFECLRSRNSLPKWGDEEWRQLLDFTDRHQLTLHLLNVPDLPSRVQAQVEVRLQKNIERRSRLRACFEEISRAFAISGIEFVLLKGFTHEIGFGICPEHRVQYDLDLLCAPQDCYGAREALRSRGYLPHEGRSLSAEHMPPFVRPSNWNWRGDYYDPDIPISIELHDSIWSAAHDRIQIDTSRFWSGRTVVQVNGMAVPALSEVDRAGFAALHVLRHVLRNDARPAHAFELARLLTLRRQDTAFWKQWFESRDAKLRTLESAGFRFAAEWFGTGDFGFQTALPPSIDAWFRECAWSPVSNLLAANKDAIWLHLALIDSWTDRAGVFFHRLTPLRFPRPNVSFIGRLRYHAAAFAPALLSGVRWWWRSTASTASQTSD